MISMLKRTLDNGPNGHGTLYNPSGWGSKFTFRDENGRNFRMPMAGKTGTSQNWADAWTLGFSPYYTTAVWFGFDKPGNSLGVTLTGSTLAGFIWADYMREIHQGLPFRDFVRPTSGIIDVTVCAKSGLLRTPSCNDGEITLTFLEGTQPVLLCDYHGFNAGMETSLRHIELGSRFVDTGDVLRNLSMPVLRDDALLREIEAETRRAAQARQSTPARTPAPAPGRTAPAGTVLSNPLLDPPVALPPPPPPEEPPAENLDDPVLAPPPFNPLLD
jgi:penicillin-binding protein 1A